MELRINDYNALIQAVATKGPISVGVAAGGIGWQLYGGGVMKGAGCGWVIDHAVVCTGYGTDSGKMYWNIRNSWGGLWGEKGYIRLQRHGADSEPCGTDNKPTDGF